MGEAPLMEGKAEEGLESTYQVSERRGCRVLRSKRSGHRYHIIRHDQAVLRRRIREIAAARIRYGYFRIYIGAATRGPADLNHKRVYRLYREEGLNMRMRGPRRHVSAARRMERPQTNAANQCWSMDFVSDALFDGRRIRALTVLDNHTRESLAIEVGQGITGEQVVRVMNRIIAVRGAPLSIRVDNVLRRESTAASE
jgi:putative transposase